MPNRPKRRLVTSTDTRNAAPVIAAQNRPKNPARSPASGNRSVAAAAHGRYREKNRTENSTAASVIHTSRRERRTYPNATVRSRHGDEVRRLALRTRGCASVPAEDRTTRHSATETASAPAQTRSRFSVPITPTSGSVSRPPATEPRISPAANSGNRRFARRVSVTTPAVPQTKTFCSRTASAAVSHKTGKIHRPSVSSAIRSAKTTAPSPAGIARKARRRSTRPSSAARPIMNTNAVAPCARYISGSASVPIRSKKSALAPLCPIARPAMPTNDRALIDRTSRISSGRIFSARSIAFISGAGPYRASSPRPPRTRHSSAGRLVPGGSTDAQHQRVERVTLERDVPPFEVVVRHRRGRGRRVAHQDLAGSRLRREVRRDVDGVAERREVARPRVPTMPTKATPVWTPAPSGTQGSPSA